jgi:hypothetical protein
MDTQKLAEKIATEILTVWWGKKDKTECTRAQLMLKQPDGSEKNMGGRNKSSIIGVIVTVLDEYREK